MGEPRRPLVLETIGVATRGMTGTPAEEVLEGSARHVITVKDEIVTLVDATRLFQVVDLRTLQCTQFGERWHDLLVDAQRDRPQVAEKEANVAGLRRHDTILLAVGVRPYLLTLTQV